MVVDIVVLLFCSAAAYVGWRRGTLRMALSLIGFVGGYVAAIFLYRPVGGLLASTTGMSTMLAYPLGGIIVMFAVSLVFRYMGKRVKYKRKRKEKEGEEASSIDRFGGAVLAGSVAVGIVFIGTWLATSLSGLSGRRMPQLSSSYTARASSAAAEKTIYSAMRLADLDPQLASTISGIMAHPGEAAASLQSLMQSDLFRNMLNDGSFMSAFQSGDAGSLASHPMMGEMMQDENFAQAFETLNMTGGSGGGNAQELAATLSMFGGGVSALQGDGEFQASPLALQIQEGITNGTLDLASITRSPQLAEMLEKINASFRAREAAAEAVFR